jgi:hypothetical protein
MDSYSDEFFQPRNLATRRRHRIESWWQIWFPLLLMIAVLSVGAYLLATANTASLANLAQLSTILIIAPLVLIGLLLLVAIGFAVYAVSFLLGWLPPLAFRLQNLTRQVTRATHQAADLVVEPVLFIDSWVGGARRLFRRFR